MLNDNLIRLYAASFRANFDLPALTDYFKEETFTYGGAAAEIARLHLLFRELGIVPGDRIALIGRNNPPVVHHLPGDDRLRRGHRAHSPGLPSQRRAPHHQPFGAAACSSWATTSGRDRGGAHSAGGRSSR